MNKQELLPTDAMKAIIAEATARLRAPVVEEPPPAVPKTKKCTRCLETKSVGEFYKDGHAKSGRRPECKTCYSKRYRGR